MQAHNTVEPGGVQIPARDFLETVFPHDLLLANEMPVIAHPDSFVSNTSGRTVDYYRQLAYSPRALRSRRAWYYCVSTVRAQTGRQVRKTLEDVRAAFVLVLDDIGTKCTAPSGPAPSYILETSAGNHQWGFLIDPYDVSTPTGQAYYDAVLHSLAVAGHNDPGFRSASRLARLPGSVHSSGFCARVVQWLPDLVYPLETLLEDMQVPLMPPRRAQALKPGKYSSLVDVADPVYRWLVDTERVWGHNDQWVYIACPWRSRHTDGAQGASSTAYSPMDYGRAGAGFKCLHGHCATRDLADFLSWVAMEKNK